MTPCSLGNHRDCAMAGCTCTDDPGGFFGHHHPHPAPADSQSVASLAIHAYRAKGGRPGLLGSAVQWTAITNAVVEALRSLPVEQRMEAMGMRHPAYNHNVWIEASDA